MRIYLLFTLMLVIFTKSSIAQLPSTTQNFVMETSVKVPLKTLTSHLTGLPVDEANRTIVYKDGLGRPLQTVDWQGSPLKKDVVQVKAYDAFGREPKQYLPYAEQTAADGAYKSLGLSNQSSFYGAGWDDNVKKTPYPFSVALLEASPLNRVLEQGAPGASWQPASTRNTTGGRTVVQDYAVNTSNDVVKLWTLTANGATSFANYAAGKLHKHTSRDENWEGGYSVVGTTETFTDLEGRVVLKRVIANPSSKLSTYYIYDKLGNLRYVLPPVVTNNQFIESDPVFDYYIYGYHYDDRKRVTEKKIPGKGWEHIVYNELDQVVLTQDSVQRANNQWYFNKYDAMGRNILSGPLNSSASRLTWQGLINAQSAPNLWEERDNANVGATNTGYTNRSLPTAGIIVHYTINYFDDYGYFGWGSAYGASDSISNRIKGLSTGVKVFVPGSGHYLLTVPYYDQEGRVVETMSNNLLVGTDRVVNTYNFAGELTASTRTHIDGAANSTSVVNRFTYDHVGRKLKSYSKIGNSGNPEVLLSELSYNEIGQLKKKQLHSEDNGATFKQVTKYAYNERGWLKNMASPEFSMKLGYDTLSNPQFNGNIRTQLWGSDYGKSFNYTYDGMSRLTSAVSGGITAMNEYISYDGMGNIINLLRTDGSTTRGASPGYIGNRLHSIGGSYGTGVYTYDANGNATFDGRTGVTLSYNMFNLPISATKAGLNLAYTYAADGRKLKKVATETGTTTTDYVDGIQYTNNVIDFIQTEEGRALNSGGTYSYQYNLTDHLGNVRYSFDIDTGTVRPLQEDDYYAFGLKRSTRVGTNKYLYNGKELQEELDGQYDYGARFYDPVIGRWNVIDPLADHPNQVDKSPYSAFWNNPIMYDDPDGQCPFCPWLDAVVDVGFVLYDVGVLVHEKVTTGKTSGANWAALGADGASILVPMSVGAGQVVKAGYKAVNKVDRGVDVVKTADKAGDVMKNRVKLQKGTKEAIQDAAPKTKDGKFIDPNTGKPIEKGQEVFGHKTGQEWSKYKKDPANQGKTRKEVIKDQNDPKKYQIEDRKSNASHKYEEKPKK